MNKFQIILRPVGWPTNEKTKPHFDLVQTMVFCINTIVIAIWNHPGFQLTLVKDSCLIPSARDRGFSAANRVSRLPRQQFTTLSAA